MNNNPINWPKFLDIGKWSWQAIFLTAWFFGFIFAEFSMIRTRYQPPVYNWITVLDKAPGVDEYGNTPGFWLKIKNSKDATIEYRHIPNNNPLLADSWKVGHMYREHLPINWWSTDAIVGMNVLMFFMSLFVVCGVMASWEESRR